MLLMTNPYDPRTWLGSAVDVTRTVLRVAQWAEEQIFDLARTGLDAISPVDDVDDSQTLALPAASNRSDSDHHHVAKPGERLNQKMTVLLDQALNQGTQDSKLALFDRLLDQLVADEARILGALSDGTTSPLINVIGRNPSRTPVLENAALIGRTANLALPNMVPAYVSHLLALGLVEVGPEDSDLKTEYEVLAAETMVLKAIKDSSVGPVGPRVDRRTLRLSPLGMELWETAMQGEAR